MEAMQVAHDRQLADQQEELLADQMTDQMTDQLADQMTAQQESEDADYATYLAKQKIAAEEEMRSLFLVATGNLLEKNEKYRR